MYIPNRKFYQHNFRKLMLLFLWTVILLDEKNEFWISLSLSLSILSIPHFLLVSLWFSNNSYVRVKFMGHVVLYICFVMCVYLYLVQTNFSTHNCTHCVFVYVCVVINKLSHSRAQLLCSTTNSKSQLVLNFRWLL